MKKIISILLCAVLLLSLVACGDKGSNKEDNIVKIGDYESVYNGAKIMKDSDDADAIVINFTYTNNSKDSQSFDWAYYYHAFQEGVELEYAVVWVSEDSYDTLDDGLQNEVQPGASLDVNMCFKLRSLTAPVEIEFSDLFDEDTDKLTIDLTTVEKQIPATDAPETEAPSESEAPTETEAPSETEQPSETEAATDPAETEASWWEGDWYGTWTVVNGTGAYAEYAGVYWDCCGYIEAASDGTYFLSLWDEDYNDYYENCLAETSMDFYADTALSPRGALMTNDTEGNYFWTQTLSSGSWYIDPAILDYQDTFAFYGTAEDENGDTYEYMVTMCKWGCQWDDNAGQRPEYYDSYFLPLMNNGEELPAIFNPSAD